MKGNTRLNNRDHLKTIRNSELVRNTEVWTKKYLFRKYCQSQNYYFTRDINEILGDAQTKAVVVHKDHMTMDEDDEYLKREYKLVEYPQKLVLLTEYYKFHTDIARIFVEPIATILNKYYDKKRKFEYYRIAKLIEEENKKNPSRPPKGIVGEKPSPINSQETGKDSDPEIGLMKVKDMQILKDISWLKFSNQQFQQKQAYKVPQQKQITKNDNSQTLQEICKNIGQVQNLETTFCLPQQSNVEEAKLDKFIKYLNSSQQPQQQHLKKQHSRKLNVQQEKLIQNLIQQQQQSNQQSTKATNEQTIRSQQFQSLKDFSQHVKTQSHGSQGNEYILKAFQQDHLISQKSSKAQNDCKNLPLNNKRTSQQKLSLGSIHGKGQSPVFSKDIRKSSQLYPQQLSSRGTQKDQEPSINQIKNSLGEKLSQKQIQKLFVEDPFELDLKWKNGAQTHRPISGLKNGFNSNRNSPSINLKVQRGQQVDNLNLLKTTKPSQQSSQQPSFVFKQQTKQIQPQRKHTSTNSLVRQPSNPERIININININDHPEYLKSKPQLPTHKKNYSDGRPVPLYSPTDTQNELFCLTDRGASSDILFKKHLTAQHSPKAAIKKIGVSGIQQLQSSLNKNSSRTTTVQNIMNALSKVPAIVK